MNVSKYKGILFIEDKLDCKIIEEEIFNVNTSGFGNQLKSLDDLKEEIYKKLKFLNKQYNVVYKFQYYQKQNILSLDDIVFHGTGYFAYIGQEDYLKYEKMINNSSLELIYSIKNETFYKSKPVQIDKFALYRLKNKYLGQCKLVNFSKKEIRKVKLEFQTFNSFGELNDKKLSIDIVRKKEDSNFNFGDNKTIVFEEQDVASYNIRIVSVTTSDEEIVYDESDKEIIERYVPFTTKISDSQFKYLKNIQFNQVFTKFNVKGNSNIPRCYENAIIDFNGDFIEASSQELLSIYHYISEKLFEDFNLFLEQEQKKEKLREKKIKENKEQLNKLKIILPLIILFCIGVFGAISIFNKVNKTPNERFEELSFDSFVDSFDKTDLELVDYTDLVNNKRPGLGQVECDIYYLIMKNNMEIGHFYKNDDTFKMVLSYIDTQDYATNEEYFLDRGSNLNTLEITYSRVDEDCIKRIQLHFYNKPSTFENCLEKEITVYDDEILDILYSIAPNIKECLKKADLLSKEDSNEMGYKKYEELNKEVYLNDEEDFLSCEEQISIPKILE